MAKKTVVRRSFPYLPVSVQAQEAASVDEQTPDYSDIFHPVIESSSTPAIEASHSESSQETSTQPSLDEEAAS
jgi:recombination protein RecT